MKRSNISLTLSGVSFHWVRQHTPALRRISMFILKEINGYFDNRRIIFVSQNHLDYFYIDALAWRNIQTPIDFAERPQMVVNWDAVYLFACGKKRIDTYKVHFPAYFCRLSDALITFVEDAAALYDPEKKHFYLFGGVKNSKYLNSIQVYSQSPNTWTVLKHKLLEGRSGCNAVKYKRAAYLVGGEASGIEVYGLDTGQNLVLYVPVPLGLMDCATVYGNYIVGHYQDLIPYIDLEGNDTGVLIFDLHRQRDSTQRNAKKRAVILDNVLYVLSPYINGYRKVIRIPRHR